MTQAASVSNITLDIQELAIAVSAKGLNPTMLTLEFLKFSGIIPNDWELTRQPVINPNTAQLAFNSGVTIAAQPGRVTFSEALGTESNKPMQSPDVARKYIEKLPNAEYQGISISPKYLIALGEQPDAVKKYITGTLLMPGSWQTFGKGLMQANVNLVYQLERCPLSVSVVEVTLQRQDKPPMPGLLFSGAFNYGVTGKNEQGRSQELIERITHWQTDLETFRELVNQRFLGEMESESIFPSQIIQP